MQRSGSNSSSRNDGEEGGKDETAVVGVHRHCDIQRSGSNSLSRNDGVVGGVETCI